MDPQIVAGIVVAVLAVAGIGGALVVRSRRALPGPSAAPEIEQDKGDPTSEEAVADAPAAPAPDSGLGELFRNALGRTRDALQGGLGALFGRAVDESLFEDLEMALFAADVGVPTTERLLTPLRELAKQGNDDPDVLRDALRAEMRTVFAESESGLLPPPEQGPQVFLVVGVNGSGKTTTIGKLAARFKSQGKSVLLAAGDTYRAAASEQLGVWADRSGADFVSAKEGADPGSVAFAALEKAAAKGHDVVIVDTAGRLQTAKPLMEQLSKICRVIDKKVPGAPHETLLVLDGTIGQNAMSQAKLFNEATPLTGVVVTKLDGTAKGGMVLAITSELKLPVKLVGVGEKIEDLRDFDAEAFVGALA